MRISNRNLKRVLAIDPFTRGFGFVVLEGSERLIDWGMKIVHGDKNAASRAQIQKLIGRYEPDLVVVEDCAAQGSRRRKRTKSLIRSILGLCAKMRVHTRAVSRLRVRRVFSASNKDKNAAMIVQRFPELTPWLPRPRERRNGFREDHRMSIFDALAFGQTALWPRGKQRKATEGVKSS